MGGQDPQRDREDAGRRERAMKPCSEHPESPKLGRNGVWRDGPGNAAGGVQVKRELGPEGSS